MHPLREAGATSSGAYGRSGRCSCFNPHPPREAGATRRPGDRAHTRWLVSIPTRPERRVQRRAAHPERSAPCLFQSPPAPRGGCNQTRLQREARAMVFQSPPAPRGGCNYRHTAVSPDHILVFQSPPAPRRGCNREVAQRECPFVSFQSPPAPRRGCNVSAADRQLRLLHRFNPHPRRDAGAIVPAGVFLCPLYSGFQSPPAPRRGCNVGGPDILQVLRGVSIPTRAETRVQFARRALILRCHAVDVSIPTRAETRVQSLSFGGQLRRLRVSIPTRAETRVQCPKSNGTPGAR